VRAHQARLDRQATRSKLDDESARLLEVAGAKKPAMGTRDSEGSASHVMDLPALKMAEARNSKTPSKDRCDTSNAAKLFSKYTATKN